jgi:hypothetical protein
MGSYRDTGPGQYRLVLTRVSPQYRQAPVRAMGMAGPRMWVSVRQTTDFLATLFAYAHVSLRLVSTRRLVMGAILVPFAIDTLVVIRPPSGQ